MPDRQETPLERAQRHIAICESLIGRRRAQLAQLCAERRSTEQADGALATLEATLKTLREYLQILKSKASDE